MTIFGKIAVIFTLILLSAFFSCAETAFFSLTRAQISKFKRSKRGYAKNLVRLLQASRETLITILFCNEIVNGAITIVFASIIYDLMGPVGWKISTLISIAIAVPVILVFCDMVPKNVAIRFAPYLTPYLVYPLKFFLFVTYPVRIVLTKFANFMVKLFGGDPTQVRSMIFEEEFRQLVDLGFKEGVLEEGESELIHRIFEFGNKKVRDIMTPAGRMLRLPIDMPLEEIVKEFRATQFSRVPVFRKNPDDIIGTLHSRDVFKLYRGIQKGHIQEIAEIVRPIHIVGGNIAIESLLQDFQKMKVHMAVVKEKIGKVAGLVTMDDIFRLLFTPIESPTAASFLTLQSSKEVQKR